MILQSTLAVEAVSFGVFTLVAALLNETLSSAKGNEEEQSALRTDYEREAQARDILDLRRKQALETLRHLQRTITRERSRAKLLSGALVAMTAIIVLATFVTVYSFTLLNQGGISLVLEIAFYALMAAPLAGALITVYIVRRLRREL